MLNRLPRRCPRVGAAGPSFGRVGTPAQPEHHLYQRRSGGQAEGQQRRLRHILHSAVQRARSSVSTRSPQPIAPATAIARASRSAPLPPALSASAPRAHLRAQHALAQRALHALSHLCVDKARLNDQRPNARGAQRLRSRACRAGGGWGVRTCGQASCCVSPPCSQGTACLPTVEQRAHPTRPTFSPRSWPGSRRAARSWRQSSGCRAAWSAPQPGCRH